MATRHPTSTPQPPAPRHLKPVSTSFAAEWDEHVAQTAADLGEHQPLTGRRHYRGSDRAVQMLVGARKRALTSRRNTTGGDAA